MCGIAGIYAYAENAPAMDQEALQAIHNHLALRGPDGQGQWHSDSDRVAMRHRRLAIIDLSRKAAQPMSDDSGRLTISFNGEIYNYRSLRQKLELKGYSFRSQSDTEVLLYLYRDRGASMLEDLSGMFAFGLWDANRQGLFLARDPYGIKPLYYSDNGNTLMFASQVKALLAGNTINTAANAAGWAGFYLFGSVPEPHTLYQGIKALEAGSSLWIDQRGPGRPRRYFSIARTWAEAGERTSSSIRDPAPPIREALFESVNRHRVGDVPVGCFLSAGVDSGALLGLMQDNAGDPVRSITLEFPDFNNTPANEAPLAERSARFYGARHTTRRITEGEFQEDLPAILDAMDQPSIDGINTWFASKAAAESGLKVAVSGLGGDELFAGYPGFRNIPRWVRACAFPAKIPWLGAAARHLFHRAPGLHPKAPGLLEYAGSYAGAYLLQRGLFMPWEFPQLPNSELLVNGLLDLQPLKHIDSCLDGCSPKAYARIATLEAELYLRNQLLRDADWAGMAHSLEIRTPLVDAQLLRQLAPLLLQLPPGRAKNWLAAAPSRALPEEILTRSKTGFQTPVGHWQKNTPETVLPKPTGAGLNNSRWHWSRHWALRVGSAFQSHECSRTGN